MPLCLCASVVRKTFLTHALKQDPNRRLSLFLNPPQMRLANETLCIDLVNIFRARRPSGKPPIRRNHLDAAERSPVPRRHRHSRNDRLAPQIAHPQLLRRRRLQHRLLRRRRRCIDPIIKRHLNSDLGALKWMYEAIDRVALAYPTELLGASDLPKEIDLGGITVLIEHRVGHTPTDLVLRVPERDIVFTGDLLFEKSYPVAFDCDMISWRKALDHLASYGRSTRFVPGHGPICGVEIVHEFADLIDDLHSHSQKMLQAGASVEEATQRYTVPARFQKFGMFSWDWAIGATMRNYYTHTKA